MKVNEKINTKISSKALIIIGLIILILLLIFVPFKEFLSKPSISGATTAKAFIKPLEFNNTCNIGLINGWNLVSIACIPYDTSIASVMSSINNNYSSIHTYDVIDTADHWKSYSPDMPIWVIQDISDISSEKGYWIKMNNDSFLTVPGTIISPATLTLIKGWNLIGYPSDSSAGPPDAFSSIIGSYSIVWAYNASAASYLYYNPNLGMGTLTEISPNRGYWINMTQDNTLWIT